LLGRGRHAEILQKPGRPLPALPLPTYLPTYLTYGKLNSSTSARWPSACARLSSRRHARGTPSSSTALAGPRPESALNGHTYQSYGYTETTRRHTTDDWKPFMRKLHSAIANRPRNRPSGASPTLGMRWTLLALLLLQPAPTLAGATNNVQHNPYAGCQDSGAGGTAQRGRSSARPVSKGRRPPIPRWCPVRD